jgi:uncharacterized iron-regulated membrane protein
LSDVLESPQRQSVEPAAVKNTRRPWRRSLIIDAHNVLGFFAAVAIIVVSLTGILLNHPDWFRLTRPAPIAQQQPPDPQQAKSIEQIIQAAQKAAPTDAEGKPLELDRANWRPSQGVVEVRLDANPIVDVRVDATTGEPVDQVVRHDLVVTAAHSGEIVSKSWVILSDIVGIVLIISVVTGVWIWLRRVRRQGRLVWARSGTPWVRANWWYHLVAGLTVSIYLVVLSVTGILLNHKQPLGFMATSPDVPERGDGFQTIPLIRIVESAIEFRGGAFRVEDVSTVDYRPSGYAKVRFEDNDFEVMVDAGDGSVLKSSRRWDVWIEDLHSGLLFGKKGWLLSDVSAVVAILLTVNGLYLWTRPGWRARNGRPA